MNESCEAMVRTPYGPTPPFECPQIVKQGTVLGGSLCASATAELCKDLKRGGAPVLTESIKAILFVDDTVTANIQFRFARETHLAVTLFSNKKKSELNETKCDLMIMNYKKDLPPPDLYIDEHVLQLTQTSRYLGDIISSNGTNNDLVNDRVKKARTATISILAMCNDVTLGYHRVKVLLPVREYRRYLYIKNPP